MSSKRQILRGCTHPESRFYVYAARLLLNCHKAIKGMGSKLDRAVIAWAASVDLDRLKAVAYGSGR